MGADLQANFKQCPKTGWCSFKANTHTMMVLVDGNRHGDGYVTHCL